MKNIALSLFVLGVVSVNAGTTTTSTSGSSTGPAAGTAALFPLIPAGEASVIAAQGGTTAGGIATNGWGVGAHHSDAWEELCDDQNIDACHHSINIAPAGSGASGDVISNQYIVAAGE
jgi:hypothetical protein